MIVLEGMVAIIPQLTQQLKSGSLFSIISELTATLLNPKMCVLMKTTLCSGKVEKVSVNVNFSCTIHFYLYA